MCNRFLSGRISSMSSAFNPRSAADSGPTIAKSSSVTAAGAAALAQIRPFSDFPSGSMIASSPSSVLCRGPSHFLAYPSSSGRLSSSRRERTFARRLAARFHRAPQARPPDPGRRRGTRNHRPAARNRLSDTNRKRRFLTWPVQRFWTGDYSLLYSHMLLGAAGFVLLICCANVASLQLARSTLRGREMAIRAAMGARPARVIRQLITESLLIAGLGAAVGLLVSNWALHIVKAGVPGEMRQYMPGWADIGLSGRALLFALAVTLLSGIVAGLAPALRSGRASLTDSLKDGGIAVSSGRGRRRLRGVLVVAEIALATVLVLGAGLMVRSFRESLNGRTRMEPATLLTLRLSRAMPGSMTKS